MTVLYSEICVTYCSTVLRESCEDLSYESSCWWCCIMRFVLQKLQRKAVRTHTDRPPTDHALQWDRCCILFTIHRKAVITHIERLGANHAVYWDQCYSVFYSKMESCEVSERPTTGPAVVQWDLDLCCVIAECSAVQGKTARTYTERSAVDHAAEKGNGQTCIA